MVELTYRRHQIATFLLLFSKIPILATFGSKMAIRPYARLAIMASNGHMASNMANMGVFRDSYKNVAIW